MAALAGPPTTDSSEAIRALLHRKVLASYRHRAAMARLLEMSESDVAAILHLGQGGLTPGQLGARLQLTSGGVTALLHRLDRAGHLDRREHPTDRRSSLLAATPGILERIAQLHEPLVGEADALTRSLPARDRTVIARYLEAIAEISERTAEELVSTEASGGLVYDDELDHVWA